MNEALNNLHDSQYDIINVIDRLKGLDTLLSLFYKEMIVNPDTVDSKDTTNYINMLSAPYVTIIDTVKTTISTLDCIHDQIDGQLLELGRLSTAD